MNTKTLLTLIALGVGGYLLYQHMSAQAAVNNTAVTLQSILGQTVAVVPLGMIGNPNVGQQFTYGNNIYTLAQSASGLYAIATQ